MVDKLISNHHRPLNPLHERYQRARRRYLNEYYEEHIRLCTGRMRMTDLFVKCQYDVKSISGPTHLLECTLAKTSLGWNEGRVEFVEA